MKFLLFNKNKSNQRLHPPRLNPTSNRRSILFQNATISSSIISLSSLSLKSIINLVSLIVVINLVFQNVGIDGQKTERILEEHTEYHHPSHVHHQNPNINRPRFRNGTLFHFGLRNRQPLPSPTLSSSSNQFAVNRINSGDNIAPNTVIHVSNRVNVLDDETDRTHTEDSWIHRDDVGSTRTGDVTGDSRTNSIRYKIISVEPTSSINNRTLSSSSILSGGSGDSRFSHRTGLDAYHRAAAGLDFDSNIDSNRDIGSSVGHTITRTGTGISLEEFGRASSTSGSGSGHQNHVDISHRFETGSDRTDDHSRISGHHHLDGGQNRIVVRPINRTVIYSGGSTSGLDSGHQNIVNVGSGGISNRTFIHNGPGGQTIHSIHRDRANLGGGGVNRTVIIHTVSTGIGSVGDSHQDHVHNRTHHIHSGFGSGTNLGITNRTFVHSGTSGVNNQIHHSTYGGHQDRIQVGALNRTGSHIYSGSGSSGAIHLGHGLGGTNYGAINRTFVHSGHGAANVGSINRALNQTGHSGHVHSAGHQDLVNVGAINRTLIRPSFSGSGSGSVIHLGHGVNLTDVANRTFVHSGGSAVHTIGGGHQDRVNLGAINRTSHIHSDSTIGGPFSDVNRATNIGSAIHLDNRNRIDGVGGLNRLQTDQSGTTSFGTGTATEYETRDRVALGGSIGTDDTLSGARLGNIRAGSSSSTTGSATQLDNVDVEAINKARIYAEQANEEQAKKHAQNVVRLAATDQLESEIITNKTRAYLSCESGEMIVKINFSEPFRGVGYADYDRSSPCRFYGDGGKYYEMRLPLKGCGTKQEAPRIFINNIILRFHRSLELEEDEIKTIICRYPPPLAPPPPLIAAPILEQPPPAAPFIPAKLSELELLLIVSALLFLTLLLLGIGIGYYCLKKRKVKVVRKFVPPAEIPYFPPPSISSEEHSIISEQSIVQRDDYQFQNLGYIPEAKLSYLDDMFYHDQDLVDDDVVLTQQNFIVPPVSQFHTKKFDDRYVTQASETDIDTDFEVDRLIVPKKPKITTLITEDYFLSPKTTTEIIDEVTTHRVVVPPKKPITTKRVDDTFITPMVETDVDDQTTRQRVFGPPKVTTEKVDDLYVHTESETEVVDDQTKHRLFGPTVTKKPIKPSVQEQDDYFRTDIYEIDEVLDDVTETKIHHGPPPTTRIVQTTEDDEIITHSRDVEEFVDDTKYRRITERVGGPLERKPKITVQNIDDFYVTNITETETNEQITKIGRSMPNLTLQVDFEEKEEVEETNRITGFDVRMRTIPRKPPSGPKTSQTITTSETITSTTTKIDEVLRVLENPPREKLPGLDEHFMLPTRNRLRQVIVTDETFRTLIMESTTIEEYVERIQLNPSYGPLFEPPTWEVIFRLLSLPEINQPPSRGPRGRYSDTYRSGVSSHEVRSVTEEDVTFTKSRVASSHYVPLPDYPMDDDDLPSLDKSKSKHWASWLPDPRHYERHSPEFSPITPAFGTTRSLLGGYGSGPRRRGSPTSGVFGPRRLENPYATTDSPSAARRRIFDYDIRPYSPDLDALSLEPSQTYLAYSGSIRKKNQQVLSEEREEIKSTTETNVYDWKRYAS